jgi:hypothetical protein
LAAEQRGRLAALDAQASAALRTVEAQVSATLSGYGRAAVL